MSSHPTTPVAPESSHERGEFPVVPMIPEEFSNPPLAERAAANTPDTIATHAAALALGGEVSGRHRKHRGRGARAAALVLTSAIAAGTLTASAAESDDTVATPARIAYTGTTPDHFDRIVRSGPVNTAEAPTDVETQYGDTALHAEIGPDMKPRLFDRRELPNATDIGALEIIYNPDNDAKRDKLWGDIDAYWASQGKTFSGGSKHPNPGRSLVHPLISDVFNPKKPLPKAYQGLTQEELDTKLLDNGFVLDNQPGTDKYTKNPNIMVVAGHNVTSVPTEVRLGDKTYTNPRMGINAPLVNGDQAKIYVPNPDEKGVVTVHTYELVDQFITQMSEKGGYEKLYKLKASKAAPLLVTYHCGPDGLATWRDNAVWKWVRTAEQRTELQRIK